MSRRPRLLLVAVPIVLLAIGGGVGGTALLGGLSSSAPARLPAAVPQVAAGPAAPSPPVGAATASPGPGAARPSSAGGQLGRSRAPRATPQLVARLDWLLETLRLQHGLPGVSATMIFADGSTWTGTSGMADMKRGTPVGEDTAFALASISKTFMAALVLDLVAEGRLELDERVAARLPGLGIDRRVTIRQLLGHRSGLHDFFLNPAIDRALLEKPTAGWSIRRSLGYMLKPYFEPGRGWRYSNTNYLLLGLIAEQVTGHPPATEIRRRYLDPLGLATAFYQDVEQPRGPVAHGYRFENDPTKPGPVALSDGTGIVPFRSVVSASGAAGSIAASSPDLARWGRALYRGQATRPETVSLMLGGIDQPDAQGHVIPYGLGVQTYTLDGYLTYGHAGRFLGSRAVLRWLPAYDVTVAVLTNQSRIDPNLVAMRLLAVAVPKPTRCSLCPTAA